MYPKLVLKPRRERAIRARHPWVFSGAVARVEGARDGDTIDIYSDSNEFLGRGYYNSHSQIVARIWTWTDEPIDDAFLAGRLGRAIERRARLGFKFDKFNADTDAFRIVNAESDYFPGLIVDAYAGCLVVQFLTLGVDAIRDRLVSILEEQLAPQAIYERSDVDVRAKEGLPERTGLLRGEALEDKVEVHEQGLIFGVDIKHGHKTGFYLDQRENRGRVAQLSSHFGSSTVEVLNAFSYTGGFGVYVCASNPRARVTNLDASLQVLAEAERNFMRNGVAERGEYAAGDAFQLLRKYRDSARQFDLIILDPPKFAYSQGQLNAACRGYKDLNLLGFKLLREGGLLVTFSCSGLVSPELFQKVVFEAAVDAGRDGQVIAKLSQSADHPVLLSFPEGEYLKGLVVRV